MMARSLRIVVADDEPRMRAYLRESLIDLGHDVVAVAASGHELVEACRAARPDLAVTDVKMPDLDGIEATAEICRETPLPVVLVSAYHDQATVERAEAAGVMAYLVKPIVEADLGPVIALAVRRFDELQALRKETADLRQTLEERKLIERAKGLLMKTAGVDEATAFQRLQKLASQKSKKLIDAARMVLAVESVFSS
jgi:AmiR/NasT family two-component response regulator